MVLSLTGVLVWPGWTGFGEEIGPAGSTRVSVVQYQRTLWDWMQLLLVPLAVAGAAGALNWLQAARDEAREARREQDAVVDTYLQQIAYLLLNEELGKPMSEDDRARQVARAQTLTALRRIDGARKGTVLGFLADSDLISVVDLHGAFLEGAHLGGANLHGAHLEGTHLERAHLAVADMREAHLEAAHLEGADLERADLKGAHLEGAHLRAAHLEGAHLERANLKGAHLERADLEGANLRAAHLEGAHLEAANLRAAHLEGAHLEAAHLERVDLHGAHLEAANLAVADLEGADLEGADLHGADLHGAEGTTLEQLTQAKSLVRVTMPDGSTYTEEPVQES
jgi:uncharacterized protein YjbI with pentapeptide repeats